ncbi:hypothetical protein ABEB36_012038 [Hypothenemus hampei]|uniref:Uncharacterized protein n=1 Tax=Hypothenemus hampei TaxID=57062 RepID=A0ABD1E9V4_HYPHA
MDQESVFLITGGASRFGKAVAKLLLSEGACLTILDLRSPPDDLRRVPQSRLLYLQVDITTEKDVFNAIHATKLKFGKLNGVINCAEIRMKSPMFNKDSLQPLLSRTIDVNFFGSLNVIRAALPLIKHNKRNSYGEKGIVINTSRQPP